MTTSVTAATQPQQVAVKGLHHQLVWCEALHSEQFQMCNVIPILSPFFLYHPYIPYSLI